MEEALAKRMFPPREMLLPTPKPPRMVTAAEEGVLASREDEEENEVTAKDPGRLIVPVALLTTSGTMVFKRMLLMDVTLSLMSPPILKQKLEKMSGCVKDDETC